jgi:putative transposase
MPRSARLKFAGVPLHIIQRGNNRIACFFAEQDYRFHLRHLQELSQRFECAVYADVLMTNHAHLLVNPSETDSASLLMKLLGQRYVQYVNHVYRRSGTLWEGRFKCSLVQRQAYLHRTKRRSERNQKRGQGRIRAR